MSGLNNRLPFRAYVKRFHPNIGWRVLHSTHTHASRTTSMIVLLPSNAFFEKANPMMVRIEQMMVTRARTMTNASRAERVSIESRTGTKSGEVRSA
jgi:hypothetical protein